MTDTLTDLRRDLEDICAERDRLWKIIEPYWQPYIEASQREIDSLAYGERYLAWKPIEPHWAAYDAASKREIEARAALHAAIMAAAGLEG